MLKYEWPGKATVITDFVEIPYCKPFFERSISVSLNFDSIDEAREWLEQRYDDLNRGVFDPVLFDYIRTAYYRGLVNKVKRGEYKADCKDAEGVFKPTRSGQMQRVVRSSRCMANQ